MTYFMRKKYRVFNRSNCEPKLIGSSFGSHESPLQRGTQSIQSLLHSLPAWQRLTDRDHWSQKSTSDHLIRHNVAAYAKCPRLFATLVSPCACNRAEMLSDWRIVTENGNENAAKTNTVTISIHTAVGRFRLPVRAERSSVRFWQF